MEVVRKLNPTLYIYRSFIVVVYRYSIYKDHTPGTLDRPRALSTSYMSDRKFLFRSFWGIYEPDNPGIYPPAPYINFPIFLKIFKYISDTSLLFHLYFPIISLFTIAHELSIQFKNVSTMRVWFG